MDNRIPLWVLLAVGCCLVPTRALDNGLGKTPPMTWSPWNHFTIHATEEMILDNARVSTPPLHHTRTRARP
jgi:hypothetical protein